MKKDTKTCKISSLCKETVVDFCNIQDTRKKVTSTEFKTTSIMLLMDLRLILFAVNPKKENILSQNIAKFKNTKLKKMISHM